MRNVEGLCYLEHHFAKLENVALNRKISSSCGLWWYFSFLLFTKENINIEKYLTNNNLEKRSWLTNLLVSVSMNLVLNSLSSSKRPWAMPMTHPSLDATLKTRMDE